MRFSRDNLVLSARAESTRLHVRRASERLHLLLRQQARRDQHEEEIMPHTRYIVVQHKDEWLIKFGDEEYGPYRSQAEAMLFAIDAAQKLVA